MTMTPDQILLVQTSFEMTGVDGTALARSLNARLEAPIGRLAGLLVLAVRGLSRRRVLSPALRRLAVRYPAIGQALHEPSVAVALVEAVEEALGTGTTTLGGRGLARLAWPDSGSPAAGHRAADLHLAYSAPAPAQTIDRAPRHRDAPMALGARRCTTVTTSRSRRGNGWPGR
jgi:hypothetical protein